MRRWIPWLVGAGVFGTAAVALARVSGVPTLTKEEREQSDAMLVKCDPLSPETWGTGKVCIPHGDTFILVDEALPAPSTDAPPETLVPSTPDSVVVSADYRRIVVGPTWRIRVLDAWLEEQRKAERLITSYSADRLTDTFIRAPVEFLGGGNTGLAALLVLQSIGYPMAFWSAYLIWIERLAGVDRPTWAEAMAATGAGAVDEFCKTHAVYVAGVPVQISYLPTLEGPQRLRKLIIEYVARFQARSFDE